MSTPQDERDFQTRLQLMQAWIGTRMEFDRTIGALSAAALGLLVTLLDDFRFESAAGLVLYLGSAGAFLVALAAVLIVFHRNAGHIKDAINGKVDRDPGLTTLDVLAAGGFALGVLLTTLLASSVAIDRFFQHVTETTMAKYETTSGPREKVEKSLNDIGGVAQSVAQPAAPAAPPAPAPTATPAAQPQTGDAGGAADNAKP